MANLIGNVYIPNEGPEDSSIYLIGEAGGFEEEQQRRPFVGSAGQLIESVLLRNGVQRPTVRFCNLSNYRPQDNKFEHLVGSLELKNSLVELTKELVVNKPNVVCALGAWPLYYLTGKSGKKPGSGILNWRGSILPCILPGCSDIKVIPCLHPAFVLRARQYYPVFDMDIRRVIDDSQFPELRVPQRKFTIAPKSFELEECVEQLLRYPEISVDIETFGDYLACVGFSGDSNHGVCIVNDNSLAFSNAISRLLQSNVQKIFHFGTFDCAYLKRKGFIVNNYAWDTLVAQHVMWPELPRALKFLSSVYTREPYYKDEGKESFEDKKSWNQKIDRTKLWTYNCKDVCVTKEIYDKQKVELSEHKEWRRFFEYEMELLGAASAISEAGLLRDERRKVLIEVAVSIKYAEYQANLEKLVDGEINVNSNKQIHTLLYDVLKLPTKRKRDGKVTANDDAIIELLSLCKTKVSSYKTAGPQKEWQQKFLILKMIGLIRGNRKLLSSYIYAKCSDDDRIHSTFKVAATETGRWAAEKYIDGSGLNSQTFPRDPVEVDDELTEEKAEALKSKLTQLSDEFELELEDETN